jgi:hypothetical protein
LNKPIWRCPRESEGIVIIKADVNGWKFRLKNYRPGIAMGLEIGLIFVAVFAQRPEEHFFTKLGLL